jgi:hypothetical protein
MWFVTATAALMIVIELVDAFSANCRGTVSAPGRRRQVVIRRSLPDRVGTLGGRTAGKSPLVPRAELLRLAAREPVMGHGLHAFRLLAMEALGPGDADGPRSPIPDSSEEFTVPGGALGNRLGQVKK